jgi:hypothetical protein
MKPMVTDRVQEVAFSPCTGGTVRAVFVSRFDQGELC